MLVESRELLELPTYAMQIKAYGGPGVVIGVCYWEEFVQ